MIIRVRRRFSTRAAKRPRSPLVPKDLIGLALDLRITHFQVETNIAQCSTYEVFNKSYHVLVLHVARWPTSEKLKNIESTS